MNTFKKLLDYFLNKLLNNISIGSCIFFLTNYSTYLIKRTELFLMSHYHLMAFLFSAAMAINYYCIATLIKYKIAATKRNKKTLKYDILWDENKVAYCIRCKYFMDLIPDAGLPGTRAHHYCRRCHYVPISRHSDGKLIDSYQIKDLV